ncbi:MAG TPA: hypothetical protein VIV11_25120 [Kofleriaceae bacterium]
MRGALIASLLCVACANAGEGGLDANGGDGNGSGPLDSSVPTSAACPMDQFATDVTATRLVACTGLDGLSRQAIGEHCSAYLGWRDDCDACTTAPAKWGRVSSASCMPGVGTNNTCTMPMLDGAAIHLFGLDLDGDMDGNDKLHAGLHCTADNSTGNGVVPCPAGQLVDGFNGTAWTCSSFAGSVIAYVQANCSVYLGWQDDCDGCTSSPSKWGYTSDAACSNGMGVDNTCLPPAQLGTEMVRLFGLNPDGDVDGNDKLHVALRCEPPAPSSSMQMTSCPAGHFVAETLPGGAFRCDSVAPSVARYFGEHCSLYFGWRDNCDGCITPPSKWGKVRVGACMNGAGADNTCSKFTLGQAVDVLGLNPDGDVDGNDALYIGFRCD